MQWHALYLGQGFAHSAILSAFCFLLRLRALDLQDRLIPIAEEPHLQAAPFAGAVPQRGPSRTAAITESRARIGHMEPSSERRCRVGPRMSSYVQKAVRGSGADVRCAGCEMAIKVSRKGCEKPSCLASEQAARLLTTCVLCHSYLGRSHILC